MGAVLAWRTRSVTACIRVAIVAVTVLLAMTRGEGALVAAVGLVVLALDGATGWLLGGDEIGGRIAPYPARRVAQALVLVCGAGVGASVWLAPDSPQGMYPLLLVSATRAGQDFGRGTAVLTVATSLATALAARQGGEGPDLAFVTAWVPWGALALLSGTAAASSALRRRSAAGRTSPARGAGPTAPARGPSSADTGQPSDVVSGSQEGELDATAAAEQLISATQARISARRWGLLAGVGTDPAAPLVLLGSDQVPWRDPLTAQDVLGRVWRSGEPEAGIVALQAGRRALLAVPLRDPAGARIGALVLDREPQVPFSRAELTAAVHLVTLHQVHLDAALSRAAMRERAGRGERARLARDLHDGIAQELGALGYRLDAIRRQLAQEHLPPARPLDEVRSDLSGLLGDLRLRIGDLQVTLGAEQRLGAVVEDRLRRFESATGIAVTTRVRQSSFRMPPPCETLLYRLVVDVLADARQAPGATALDLTLELAAPQVFLRVCHDGRSNLFPDDFADHPLAALGAELHLQRTDQPGVVLTLSLGRTGGRPTRTRPNDARPNDGQPTAVGSTR